MPYQDDIQIEWMALSICPICKKMADELLREASKLHSSIKKESTCSNCGRLMFISKMKFIEEENKFYCFKCYKRVI